MKPSFFYQILILLFFMSEVAHDNLKKAKTIDRFPNLVFDGAVSSLEYFNLVSLMELKRSLFLLFEVNFEV